MTTNVITYQMLVELGVHESQIEILKATFGDPFEVTEENIARALKLGINIWYLAANFRAEHERARREAWEEHELHRRRAWAEYQQNEQSAWAEYNRVCQILTENFEYTVARAFVSAYSQAPLDIDRTQI